MKTYFQKLMATAVFGLALVSQSLPAWAGAVFRREVEVVPTAASGSMVAARYSGDSQQYIGCSFSSGSFITCLATDKTGRSFVCSKNDPSWSPVVKAITDSSYLLFGTQDGVSCSALTVDNFSSGLR